MHPLPALRFTPLALAVSLLALGVDEALAQATAADPANPTATETVTVTAQRRREPAREVPLTANVLDAGALERDGSRNLADVAAALPGLNFNQSAGGQSQVTMRGVSTGAQVGATVSLYVDELPIGSSSAYAGGSSTSLNLGLFDLSRIEVLRGPQGTLYGAGAMGGLIKYVLATPELDQFSGSVSGELSTTSGGGLSHIVRAGVNAPLSKGTAAVRASAYRSQGSGFIRDVARGIDPVDGSTLEGARVALQVQPTRGMELRFTAMTQSLERDGGSTEDVSLSTGQPVDGRQTRRLLIDEPLRVKNDLASATLDTDLAGARLAVIAGWQQSQTDARLDQSGLYGPLLAPQGLQFPGYRFDGTFKLRKTSGEIRLTSPASRRFEWLAGLFVTDESGTFPQTLQPVDASGSPQPPLLLEGLFTSGYREQALYGTGTYYFSPAIDATLGVRQARNKQWLLQLLSGVFAPPFGFPRATGQEDVTTWMATLRWRPAAKQSLYLRAASSYRPGGPLAVLNDPLTGQPLGKDSFKSDTLWTYEAGWKADLMGGRLSTELAVFHIDWEDIQVFTSTAGFSGMGNAGRARSQGLEWTLRAAPTQQLSVSAALSLVDAQLLEDGPPDVGGRRGDRLPDTARVSLALQGDYQLELFGRPASLGATARHTGDRVNAFAGNPGMPQYRLPAYSTLDLRAGMEFGSTRIGLYARNVTNARGQVSAASALSALGAPARVALTQPRTVGVQLTAEF